jgi:DNA invertase Pin-like site-specific DNA recombinase
MKKAYSYQRFSSIKQKEGDSTKRQTNAAEGFCRQHGLTLVDTFTDEGVSGFKGKNFSNESALSEFLKLVENGTVERNSCLVVENMDRLSRQSILPCMTKFMEMTNRRCFTHHGLSLFVRAAGAMTGSVTVCGQLSNFRTVAGERKIPTL